MHDSYEALLADPGIEAVYIPLPNHLHVEWATKAMQAGKHVLCEKPIAMKADQIDALIELRDQTGLLATEAYMIVHHPQWQHCRQLVEDGAIGRIVHADASFSYDNSADTGNIRNRPETGGGSIPDIGVYAYGCLRWVTGAEPAGVTARIVRENGVDVFAQVQGEMEGKGNRFTFAAMTSMRLFPRQEVVFQGETGLIRMTAPFNAGLFGEAQLHMFRAGKPDQSSGFPGSITTRCRCRPLAGPCAPARPMPGALRMRAGRKA